MASVTLGRVGSAFSGSNPRRNDAASRSSVVIDQLIARLRVADHPERFQNTAVAEGRKARDVAAVAWVPASSREPVVMDGAVDGLAADGLRILASRLAIDAVCVRDNVNDPSLPSLRGFVASSSGGE